VLLRGWVAAGELKPSDSVRKADGSFGSVEQVTIEQRTAVMYNLTVDVAHTYFVGEQGWLVHNTCNPLKGPAKTEPTLPKSLIAEEKGITIEHYYHSGDHGPAHAHVTGGGPEVKIGPNGKPISGQPELSAAQKQVIKNNKSAIRRDINKIGRWLDFNDP
jgi:Pretoxin HINT domain